MPSQVFRANVGIAVARADGRVLALERADQPGRWQLPQGGLGVDEEPLQASLRELREETGLRPDRVELVAEHPSWLAYELPPERRRDARRRGQVQKWFLYRFIGRDDDIDLAAQPELRQEFRAYRWMTLEEVAAQMWEVKRPVYDALVEAWSRQLRDWPDRAAS